MSRELPVEADELLLGPHERNRGDRVLAHEVVDMIPRSGCELYIVVSVVDGDYGMRARLSLALVLNSKRIVIGVHRRDVGRLIEALQRSEGHLSRLRRDNGIDR